MMPKARGFTRHLRGLERVRAPLGGLLATAVLATGLFVIGGPIFFLAMTLLGEDVTISGGIRRLVADIAVGGGLGVGAWWVREWSRRDVSSAVDDGQRGDE